MHVVLEGPDNAGKTTLANFLTTACESAVVYYHPGGKPRDLEDEQAYALQQYEILSRSHSQYLMDRVTSISQQVYNPDNELDRHRMACLMALTEFDHVLFVYCRPSTDRLLRTQDLTWRPEETEEHKQKIISRQHEFVASYDRIMTLVPCISYDYESSTAPTIRTKLVNALNGSADDRRWFHDIIHYRG